MAGTLAAAPAMCWGSLARCRVPTSRELSRATPTTEARPVKLRLVSRAVRRALLQYLIHWNRDVCMPIDGPGLWNLPLAVPKGTRNVRVLID